MKKKLATKERDEVRDLIDTAMDAPADDDLVAAVYSAYLDTIATGEGTRDRQFEAEVRAHLTGTRHEKKFFP